MALAWTCMVVGVPDDAFTVHTRVEPLTALLVQQLHDQIRASQHPAISGATRLRLVLATERNNQWLALHDADVTRLSRGIVAHRIRRIVTRQLQPSAPDDEDPDNNTRTVARWLNGLRLPPPQRDPPQLHVLVVVAEPHARLHHTLQQRHPTASFDVRDLQSLAEDERAAYHLLRDGETTTTAQVTTALQQTRHTIKTTTRRAIAQRHGFALTGPPQWLVAPHVALYTAYDVETGVVYAAKVYSACTQDGLADFEHERVVSAQLSGSGSGSSSSSGTTHGIVRYNRAFRYHVPSLNMSFGVLVLPFVSDRTVRDLLETDAFLSPSLVAHIARDCVASLRFLHHRQLSVGGFQPHALALHATASAQQQQHHHHTRCVTLVDLSGIVPLGTPLRKSSPRYRIGLDTSATHAPAMASRALDYVCLAVLLAELERISVDEIATVAELAAAVTESTTMDTRLGTVIHALLLLLPLQQHDAQLPPSVDETLAQLCASSHTNERRTRQDKRIVAGNDGMLIPYSGIREMPTEPRTLWQMARAAAEDVAWLAVDAVVWMWRCVVG